MHKVLLSTTLLLMAFGYCHAQVVTGQEPPAKSVRDTSYVVIYKDKNVVDKKAQKAERDAIERRVVISTNVALWAPSLKIEGRVSPYVTVGGVIKARFTYFTGAKIDPFVRWYPFGKAPRGFFTQLKASVGVYHTRILHPTYWLDWYQAGNDLPYTIFQAYGGGITVGYQLLVGHERRGAIEFFGGFQYIYYTIPITNEHLVQKLSIMMPLELGIRFGGAF